MSSPQYLKGQLVKVSDELSGNIVEVESQNGDTVVVWEWEMVGTSKVYSLRNYRIDQVSPVEAS